MRRLLWVCTLCLSGCVYFTGHTPQGACTDDLRSPIRNFCVVAPGVLWRGERATSEDATWLLDRGVGSVLSVQIGSLKAFAAARPRPDVERAVAPRPLYMHCRAGIDRTGVLAAAYRVLIEGARADDAIAEMARFHSPWQRIDARYVRTLAERRSEILRQVEELRPRLHASARIECSRGQCAYSGNEAKID